MPQLELSIDVDHVAVEGDGLQVRGTLFGPDGAHPFVGWIGLLALLQQALTAPDASPRSGH
ncbi:MAG: hypothetical protein ACRD0V_09030 [Acidimicrobiales bacterium]